jgi:hypothetical protein
VSAAGSPPQPGFPPAAGLATPADDPGALSTIRTAGIVNIIVAVVNALWAGLMALETAFIALGAMDADFAKDPDSPPKAVMVVMCATMFFFSAATTAVQALAGFALLNRKPSAARLALASGIASVVSLWGCCVYVFSLGAGAFTLYVAFSEKTKAALERA